MNDDSKKPFIFRTWRSWYAIVIAVLVAIILLLEYIARTFR